MLKFNITKATPTTSTTNTTTTSLQATPAMNTRDLGSTRLPSPSEASKFHDSEKAPSLPCSNESTNTTELDSSSSCPTPSDASGKKEDLIKIFDKFDLETNNNSDAKIHTGESFSSFESSKQNETVSRDVNRENCQRTSSSSIEVKVDRSKARNLALTELEDGTSEDEAGTNQERPVNSDANQSSLDIRPIQAAIDGETSIPQSRSNPTAKEPHITSEETTEPESPSMMTQELHNKPFRATAEEAASSENSASDAENDILIMDINEPVEEVTLSVSEDHRPESKPSCGDAQTRRPHARRKGSIVKASEAIVSASQQHERSHRPFDFQVFLSHLRSKSADPIVRYIRSFLMSFARQASSMSATQMMKAIKNFKLFIEEKFHVYEPFASMGESDIENSFEGVEKLIMNRLYEFCFAPEAAKKFEISVSSAMTQDISDDDDFASQIEKFNWVSGVHLDVDLDDLYSRKKHATKDDIDHMEYASSELKKINNYRAPRDKIICILNACKILFSLLRVTAQETNADAFIPLLILVILKSKTDHIISNLHYIERFRGERWLNHGETSYYLSTVQGAITFIQNIKKEDLTIDSTHFDAHMEAWGAELRQRSRDAHPVKDTGLTTDTAQAARNKIGLLPSNVLMASAEMFSKSISNLMTSSDEGGAASSPNPDAYAEVSQHSGTDDQFDGIFKQLSEIFPSLDGDIMRDIILMNDANFEKSLEICLQLANDD